VLVIILSINKPATLFGPEFKDNTKFCFNCVCHEKAYMLILTAVQMNKDAFVAYLMMKGCAGNNEMFNLLCIFSTL